MPNDAIADRHAAAVPDRSEGGALGPDRRPEPSAGERALLRSEPKRLERAGPRRFDDLF